MMRSRKSYLGGEVGFELLKRALKVVRVVMVVVIWSDVVVYVQEMMVDDGFLGVFYTREDELWKRWIMQEEILFIQVECVFGFGVWCRRGWRKVVAVGATTCTVDSSTCR